MHAWNRHEYPKAVKLFQEHRAAHPDSPWAGEAALHLGCNAQFSGSWEEAKTHFEWILSSHAKGTDIYQKAKLRRSVLHLDQGQFAKATESFVDMLETENDWERRTYAHHWIRQISLYKTHQAALRACGNDSLAYILASKGSSANAEIVRTAPAAGEHGFTLGELAESARQNGLAPKAVRATRAQLDSFPTPFIAHYSDQHFVVIACLEPDAVEVFDPRLQRETRLSLAQFTQQWSGLALLFDKTPAGIQPASEFDLVGETGGCCGIPRPPENLGGDPNRSCGLPSWQVNPVNMNLVVQDIPMWRNNPIGPPVRIELTYNSQDSLNQLRPVGNKWVLNYASYAMESPGGSPAGAVLILMPDGRHDTFQPNGAGGYTSPAGVFNRLTKTAPFAFDLRFPDDMVYHYGVPVGMGGTSSLLLSIEDRFHNFITINHDANGAITSVVDPLNQAMTFFYNAQGMVSRIDDSAGRSATFNYDTTNNLIGQVDMGGTVYGYAYDTNIYLTALIKPSGTTSFYVEPADGIANGSAAYPAFGTAMWESYRITITDPLGQKEEYHYDGASSYSWYRDKLQYQSPVTALNAPKTRYDFTLVAGRGKISTTTYADGAKVVDSNFTSQQQPQTITDANGNAERFTYNSMGRVLTRSNALGIVTRFLYAANNIDLLEVHQTSGNSDLLLSGSTYNAQHLPLTTTDAAGRTVVFTYNSQGQLLALTDQRTNTTSFTYNGSGYLVKETNPLGGETIHTYDAAGRRASLTDPKQQTFTYAYDGLNRLTEIHQPDASVRRYTYDCCVLASVSDANGTNTFEYDALKRMIRSTDPFNQSIQYVYDANQNVTNLVYPDGKAVRYEYDVQNRMTKVSDWLGNTTTYAYDKSGRLISGQNSNGTLTRYQYDAANRLMTLVNAKSDGSIIAAYKYSLDSLGNRTNVASIGALQPALASNNVVSTYAADNRILAATGATFIHDTNGNLTAMGGTKPTVFAYDVFNHLTQVAFTNHSASYLYDPNRNRIAKSVNGIATRFIVDSKPRLSRLLAETDNAGNASAYYVHGLGLISKIKPSGHSYFYHYDAIGSTAALTDSAGIAVNKYAYDPFGNLSSDSSETIPNPFRYSGGWGVMDEGNGLLFMRARYYSTDLKRFTKKDPLGLRAGLNLYDYVGNNPISRTDPSGLFPISPEVGSPPTFPPEYDSFGLQENPNNPGGGPIDPNLPPHGSPNNPFHYPPDDPNGTLNFCAQFPWLCRPSCP